LVRYVRVSDRFGPIMPVRRIDPFRQEDPTDREWVRMLFDAPSEERKARAQAAFFPDATTAPLYDEAGKLRDLNSLEVGVKMDLST
jgi:hypothetical protein